MPKSRSDRKKKVVYTPPPSKEKPKVSPRWLVPTMLGFFIAGILWIAVYYIAGSSVPYMQDWQNWNLLIGFSGIVVAIVLATRWH